MSRKVLKILLILTLFFIANKGIAHIEYDNLGNVRSVVNESGEVLQYTHYYPNGNIIPALSTSSSLQPYKYNGKELDKMHGLDWYDYGARNYDAVLSRWDRIDPLAEKYYHISPYAYCAGNPVNRIDNYGEEICGVTRRDTKEVVNDIRNMFPGEEFERFRNLIQQSGKNSNGKSLAKISSESLEAAFEGITLNADQIALRDIVVNTINSTDKHYIEYAKPSEVLSKQGEDAFGPQFESIYRASNMTQSQFVSINGGLKVSLIINAGGGGATVATSKGSHSVIVDRVEYHPNGQSVTTGHELFGHGRSLVVGQGSLDQHVEAIRVENLILRVMGIPFINYGLNHGPRTTINKPSALPSFR